MKAAVIAGSQRWIHWDEAIVALCAKQVLHGQLPIYFPGQPYGGGAAFEALGIALLFLIVGVSTWAVKGYALLASIAGLVLIYRVVNDVWGRRAAVWSSLLWATAPGLAIFSLQVRAGYLEMQVFAALILVMLHRAVFVAMPNKWDWFALGVVCGLAYYNFPLSLPLLLATGVAVLSCTRNSLKAPAFISALIGLALGVSPMIYYEFTRDFGHLNWIFLQRQATVESIVSRVWNLVSFEFPSAFQPYVDDYGLGVDWRSWALYGTSAVLMAFWHWFVWPDVASFAKGLFRPAQAKPTAAAVMNTVIFLANLFYLVFYLLGPPRSPRYLLGFYPFASIAIGVVASGVVARRKNSFRRPMAALAGIVLAGGAAANIHLMNLSVFREILSRPKLIEGGTPVSPGGIEDVRRWLAARNLNNVFAHPVIRWKLMFYANESIAASSVFSTFQDDGKPGLPNYGLIVQGNVFNDSQPYALVFHKDFAYQGDGGGWAATSGDIAIIAKTRPAAETALQSVIQWAAPRDRVWASSSRFIRIRDFVEESWRTAGITWSQEQIGDYIVYHDFEGGSGARALWNRLTDWQPPGAPPPPTTP
jgi:4-amino-4-deoxy-L-arabinose transferase-like glycosyltransferase